VGGILNWVGGLFHPLVVVLHGLLEGIHHVVPVWSLDLILFSLVVRVALFPLSQAQFKSMAEMQKISPLVKELQARYKDDPQKMNTAVMALYKEHNVNPFASCLPLLLQMPILFSLFYAVRDVNFGNAGFLWISQSLAAKFPALYYDPEMPMIHQSLHFFASNLAQPDIALLALYVVSMYFSVRFGSPPSTDPAMAQQQKIMAVVSPLMIAFFGFKAQWPSALILYWFALNVFTMIQQIVLYRRYGLMGGTAVAIAAPPQSPAKNGKVVTKAKNVTPASNGKPANTGSKRSKKGAN
jgi:YidC/Oxa1 family membrane protein insertase